MGRKRSRIPVPASVERVLDVALDKALAVQRPVVLAYLDRARRRKPSATPAEVITQLEQRYLAAVVGIGAASGGAAAMPGAGTAASVASGAAEITAFVSATAVYVLAVAEVHGIPTHDPEVRRALVLAVLIGEGATAVLEGASPQSAHWAQVIANGMSKEHVGGINAHLAQLMVRRFGARQGALLVGRALPLGLGVGIGAVGNAALARAAVASARRVFGPAPAVFGPRVVEGTVVPGAALERPEQ